MVVVYELSEQRSALVPVRAVSMVRGRVRARVRVRVRVRVTVSVRLRLRLRLSGFGSAS